MLWGGRGWQVSFRMINVIIIDDLWARKVVAEMKEEQPQTMSNVGERYT